jgi:large subunit ribosomal protein L22
MESAGRAVAKFIKISPYKVRKVVALIKGKDVNSALAILKNTEKRSTLYLERALNSAIASAKQGGKVKQDDLYISKIMVDDGPVMKRYKAAAMGRATTIRKRSSHISIEVGRPAGSDKKVSVKSGK